MARPKQFDRDAALNRAIDVFAELGYEGSSTDMLLGAMGVSRQSLYDTFGSKTDLYVEALRRYNAESAAGILRDIQTGPTAMAGVHAALVSFINRIDGGAPPTCLGVGAVMEFGGREPAVAAASADSRETILGALTAAFERARAEGDLREDVEPDLAAALFLSTLGGLKISARGGMPTQMLHQIGNLALDALRARRQTIGS